MADVEELTRLDDPNRGDPDPPRWLGIGALGLAVAILLVAVSLFSREPEVIGSPIATTTTVAEVTLPDRIIARDDGIFFNGQRLSNECARKAASDELGGLLIENCESSLIHLKPDGQRLVLSESGYYGIDTVYIQDGQEGAVLLALGNLEGAQVTSTYAYFSQAGVPLSMVMPPYSDVSRGKRVMATVGVGPGGELDPGCLQIQSMETVFDQGCGDDDVEVAHITVSPTDTRLAMVTVDAEGTIEVAAFEISRGNLVASLELDEMPADLDFDGEWLALIYRGDPAVSRLVNIDTYHSEDVEGVVSFRQGS